MFEYQATVTRVIDADTVDMDVDLGFYITLRERFRLSRIDAWEVRGVERPEGLLAKDALIALFEEHGNRCVINTEKGKGKYGRWIAEITLLGDTLINVSDWLVDQGHAEYRDY